MAQVTTNLPPVDNMDPTSEKVDVEKKPAVAAQSQTPLVEQVGSITAAKPGIPISNENLATSSPSNAAHLDATFTPDVSSGAPIPTTANAAPDGDGLPAGSTTHSSAATTIAATGSTTPDIANTGVSTSTTTTKSSSLATAEKESGLAKSVPFAYPALECVPAKRADLTEEQQSKYNEILEYCRELKTIPLSAAAAAASKDAEQTPLTESERMWLTEECMLRYLKAVKWAVPEAKKRVVGTLVWRREWGVERHTSEYIEEENRTGKQVIIGYDNEARPCLYLNPARQNTERSNKQIEHLVFMLERVVDIMPPGQETLALVTDFASTNSGKTPPLWQGKQTLNILQMHYPERLGRALVVNIPWFVWGFFKLITPFIDPVTRPKLKFNEPLTKHVPESQLLKEFGGQVEMAYDHSKYWPALNALAESRRTEMIERWKANGSKIGESESYLRGGKTNAAAAIKPPSDAPLKDVTEKVANIQV